uniref:Uncharacterized protein n=1 Tax=Solanum lycopersicum TaxID=4081 RepID=A0A3Q7F707_SOLLC
MRDFKAFELIRVLASRRSVSFPPHQTTLFVKLHVSSSFLILLLCFINLEDVEVLFSVEETRAVRRLQKLSGVSAAAKCANETCYLLTPGIANYKLKGSAQVHVMGSKKKELKHTSLCFQNCISVNICAGTAFDDIPINYEIRRKRYRAQSCKFDTSTSFPSAKKLTGKCTVRIEIRSSQNILCGSALKSMIPNSDSSVRSKVQKMIFWTTNSVLLLVPVINLTAGQNRLEDDYNVDFEIANDVIQTKNYGSDLPFFVQTVSSAIRSFARDQDIASIGRHDPWDVSGSGSSEFYNDGNDLTHMYSHGEEKLKNYLILCSPLGWMGINGLMLEIGLLLLTLGGDVRPKPPINFCGRSICASNMVFFERKFKKLDYLRILHIGKNQELVGFLKCMF